MQDDKIKYPHIAMIVSDSYDICLSFVHLYGLNPKCFLMATMPDLIMGVDRKIPVIIIHHGNNEKYRALHEAVLNRSFENVRYLDY